MTVLPVSLLCVLPLDSDMPRNRLNTVFRLALVPLCVAASGCFLPGGGWTLRTGVDLRRVWKPSAFVELVDTKWDEYNRIEEKNLSGVFINQGPVFQPGSPPIDTAPAPPPTPAQPPSSARTGPTTNGMVPPASSPASREPTLLPGASDDATDAPQTVQQPDPVGPQIPDAAAVNNAGLSPDTKPARRPIASRLFHRP